MGFPCRDDKLAKPSGRDRRRKPTTRSVDGVNASQVQTWVGNDEAPIGRHRLVETRAGDPVMSELVFRAHTTKNTRLSVNNMKPSRGGETVHTGTIETLQSMRLGFFRKNLNNLLGEGRRCVNEGLSNTRPKRKLRNRKPQHKKTIINPSLNTCQIRKNMHCFAAL